MRQVLEETARLIALADPAVDVVLGDPGMSAPVRWPVVYVAPFNEAADPRMSGGTAGSNGVDLAQLTVEVMVVESPHDHGVPITAAGQPFLVQPSAMELVDRVEKIRATLRANIQLGGSVTRSDLQSTRYGPLDIDTRVFRAARMVVTATKRRSRQ